MLNPDHIDFDQVGFHAGLEIHHQINSDRKLFCHCRPEMVPNKTPPDYRFERYFRPVLGEMGDFDPGMLIEYEKGYRVIYNAYEKCDCIYEQDEQPPMHPDVGALMSGYELAHWLNCSALIDEIIFARKQYLDGSITTGFQRTTIVARDGWVEVDGHKIAITNITVEEDSARKIKTENNGRTVYYNLDRLGIPLVEVITDHQDVTAPAQLEKAARMIGLVLRESGIGKRGIGTARQDVNISIAGGDRVELKGVQHPEWFDRLCRHEICRQDTLLQIAAELRQRGALLSDFEHTYTDISDLFPETPDGSIVMAIRLPKLEGILGTEIQPGKDFGQDILEKASLISGVPAAHLFHSDEMAPTAFRRIAATKKNQKHEGAHFFFSAMDGATHHKIQEILHLRGGDAYFLALGSQKWAIHALKKVIERVKMAFDGVPQETRRALPDGNSEFLRVIHGKERLYPDTDTPVLDMDMEAVEALRSKVGKRPWEYEREYAHEYGLGFEEIAGLIRHGTLGLFERCVKDLGIDAHQAYKYLEQTLRALKRDGAAVDALPDEKLVQNLQYAQAEKFDWALLPELVRTEVNHPDMSLDEILAGLGVVSATEDALEAILHEAEEVYQAYEARSKYKAKETDANPTEYKVNQITGIIMRKLNHGYSGEKVYEFVKSHLEA